MKLVADDTRLQIDRLDGTLTAEQVDDLIGQLAVLRSTMSPPVARKRPTPLDSTASSINVEDEPEMVAVHLRDGRFRLWVRNSGFGWCAYNVSAETTRGLANYMLGRLPAAAPGVDLFSNGDSKTH